MSRGFLIMTVGDWRFAVPSALGDVAIERLSRVAAKHGFEIKGDGHRRTFKDREEWPLTLRAYTSFRADGCGRSGSTLQSFPARHLPCGHCGGRGRLGLDPVLSRACKRCDGTGHKGGKRTNAELARDHGWKEPDDGEE